jgi:hypothetical protein
MRGHEHHPWSTPPAPQTVLQVAYCKDGLRLASCIHTCFIRSPILPRLLAHRTNKTPKRLDSTIIHCASDHAHAAHLIRRVVALEHHRFLCALSSKPAASGPGTSISNYARFPPRGNSASLLVKQSPKVKVNTQPRIVLSRSVKPRTMG